MGNRICVFKRRSDIGYVYDFTFGNGSDRIRKKSDLVRIFVFTRVHQIQICVR